jgi:hypothetical protein
MALEFVRAEFVAVTSTDQRPCCCRDVVIRAVMNETATFRWAS